MANERSSRSATSGSFRPGVSGNPRGGRRGPRLTGRALMLKVLDGVLSQPAAERLMRETMTEALAQDPIKFFEDFVMPLLPKEQLIRTEEIDKAPLRIIMTSDGVNMSGSVDTDRMMDTPTSGN